MEKKLGKTFGMEAKRSSPLLLALRVSAPVSIPGLAESVLFLGLNDEIVQHMVPPPPLLSHLCREWFLPLDTISHFEFI